MLHFLYENCFHENNFTTKYLSIEEIKNNLAITDCEAKNAIAFLEENNAIYVEKFSDDKFEKAKYRINTVHTNT